MRCDRKSVGVCVLIVAALCGAPSTGVRAQDPQPDFSAAMRAKAPDFSGTVLVARRGHVLFHRSFGLAERSFGVPNANDTRYRIASITKLFTAVMTLQLHQEGKLDLHQPVARYLESCAGAFGSAATVHQILNHTSGIADIVAVKSKEQGVREGIELFQRPSTPAAIAAKYCAAPPRDRPGASYFYNNGDYIVLGRIIEAIEGDGFASVLSRRILAPLALTSTGMDAQHRVVPNLAHTYFTRDDADQVLSHDMPIYIENWDAAGAMYSSSRDLLRFAEALFDGRLLSPPVLSRLVTPGLDHYGYGTWIYKDAVKNGTQTAVMRPGQVMGINTVLYRVVEPGLTIVILANTDQVNVDALAHHLSTLLPAVADAGLWGSTGGR